MRAIRTIPHPLFVTLFALLIAGAALAHGYKLGDLDIGHPYSRATAGKTGAGYFSVTNNGTQADRLLRATIEPAYAERAEMHATSADGDVMRMRPVQAVDLPPGQKVVFGPGSLHVMLVGLKAPLKVGDRVPLTLVFERAGSVTVELTVDKGATESHEGHH